MIKQDTPLQNATLQALTINEYKTLYPSLERVQIFFGEILYELDEESSYLYFPTSSVVSLFILLENGSSSEVAVVGNEGVLGFTHITDGKATPYTAIVTKSGFAYRLEKHLLTQKLESVICSTRNRLYRFKQRAEAHKHSFAA